MHRSRVQWELIPVLHRIFSILLIGSTLLASSVCCCTVNASAAEVTDPRCCCSASGDLADRCPENSDGKREHDCPCRQYRDIGARLDESRTSPTGPSVQWTIILSEICSPVCFRQANDLNPRGIWFPQSRSETMPAGAAILIAICVSRC